MHVSGVKPSLGGYIGHDGGRDRAVSGVARNFRVAIVLRVPAEWIFGHPTCVIQICSTWGQKYEVVQKNCSNSLFHIISYWSIVLGSKCPRSSFWGYLTICS